ncbi:MAG: arylmalonate decarboxylase [Alphaproteobacteria bacterium]
MVRYDQGAHSRAKLGFVLLASEQTIEDDLMRMRPAGVGVHFTRVRNSDTITVDTLRAMRQGLADAASLIAPEAGLNVVCYACTSGSVVIGEDEVIAELGRGAPHARATTLVTGVVEGLRALEARRIVVGTPYLDEINAIERDFLERKGFEILAFEGLNIRLDTDIVRVSPKFIYEFARALDKPDADAIFISCGALRTLEVIQDIEAALGKPVVASNQAMMWHCLRLAGIGDRLERYGRLFQH